MILLGVEKYLLDMVIYPDKVDSLSPAAMNAVALRLLEIHGWDLGG